MKRFSMKISVFAIVFFISLSTYAVGYKGKDSLGVRTVIIDPGHGGKDPGCLGKYSHEADVALAISLKFGDMIKAKYGDKVKVIYTRTKDEFVELHDRAKMANKHKGDLFVCIHANSGQEKARGSEVYVLGLHRTESQLKVAQKENASILMEDNYKTKYQDFDPTDPDNYLILTQLANSYLTNSMKYAEKIEKYFKVTPKLVDRGVKQAGFLVLHQVNMPSVLIETGFLTNPEEEHVLNDKQSQEDIARAIFDAFVEYKTEVDGINNVIEGKRNPEQIKEEVTSNKENTNAAGNGKENVKENNGKENVKEEVTRDEKTYTHPEKNNNNTDKNKIWFKVQIAASNKKMELVASNFKGLEGVDMYELDGLYRYTYGKSDNFELAKQLLTQVREKGYTSAFIVAFQNGERMDINKARELASK